MAYFEYFVPSVEEVLIENPIDRIANIAHSCYQVAPKDHASNVKFVTQLCSVRHMAMLDHGFMHFRFRLEDLKKIITPSLGEFEIAWPYAKYFEFAADPYFGYITLSLRSLVESIDWIASTFLFKENQTSDLIGTTLGQSYQFLIATLIRFLPEEIKDIVLTHFVDKKIEVSEWIDQTYDFLNASLLGNVEGCPYKVLTNEELKSLSVSIRDSQEFRVYCLITDRGITHELVRHRTCAFAQESTRYCNYSRAKFGDKLKIMKPLDYEKYPALYDDAFTKASDSYFALLKAGATPQEARHVLPNGLRAQLTITANLKEWKHIFSQRLAPDAHPEARRVVQMVFDDMKKKGIL